MYPLSLSVSLLSKQKILDQKMLIVVLCGRVCVFVSLKYFKRTVIRIVTCCVCVFLCEQAVPFYKTNSTIEHITPSFRCFSSASFLAFLFHCSHRSVFSLSARLSRILLAKKKLCISPLLFFLLFLFFLCLLLLFWFDDDCVYGMHSLICFSLICDQ